MWGAPFGDLIPPGQPSPEPPPLVWQQSLFHTRHLVGAQHVNRARGQSSGSGLSPLLPPGPEAGGVQVEAQQGHVLTLWSHREPPRSTGFWAGGPRLVLCLSPPPLAWGGTGGAQGWVPQAVGELHGAGVFPPLGALAGPPRGWFPAGSPGLAGTPSPFGTPRPVGCTSPQKQLSLPCSLQEFPETPEFYVRELRFSPYLYSPSLEIKILSLRSSKEVGWFVKAALLEETTRIQSPGCVLPPPHLPSYGGVALPPGAHCGGSLLPSGLPPKCSSHQEPWAAAVPGLSLLLATDIRVGLGGQVC